MSRLPIVVLGSSLAALCLSAYLASSTPAVAGEYCFNDPQANATLCNFDSLEQCRLTSSGRGGSCFRDPWSSYESFSQEPRAPESKSKVHHVKAVQSR
jgi:hypothetical protein